jgi:hypothetical protein
MSGGEMNGAGGVPETSGAIRSEHENGREGTPITLPLRIDDDISGTVLESDADILEQLRALP